jgi:hypothetical protein
MAIQTNKIKWVGPADANASTQYRIEADKTTPGTFETVDTVSAQFPYAAAQTTLDGNLTQTSTSVTLTSATGIVEDDIIVIGSERIRLGTQAGLIFNNCERGVEGTLSEAHSDGDDVLLSHEEYIDEDVDFGERHAMRYRIIRIQDSIESLAIELIAFAHPIPNKNQCILFGVIERLDGGLGKSGVPVALTLNELDNYGPDTGELIYTDSPNTETKESDADGYWHFKVRRDIARLGGGALSLLIGALPWNITSIPDREFINFLEI